MAPTQQSHIDQNQWDALRHQASRYTYCLIGRAGSRIGTAVAIRLGEHFFLASAKHIIDNDHEMKILLRGSVAPLVSSDVVEQHCDEQRDIGLLEIRPSLANRLEFIDSAQLLPEIDGDEELPVIVVGYPGQFVHQTEIPITNESLVDLRQCDALTYRSVLLPQSEWPDSSELSDQLVAGRDLLVDFTPEPRITPLPPGRSLCGASEVDWPNLDPHGLSGGGIWLARVEDRNGLWVSDIRLVGIQTGWYEQNGWLRGVQIGAWLEMVDTKYCDVPRVT